MFSVPTTNAGRIVSAGVGVCFASIVVLVSGCESEQPAPRRTIDRSPQAKFERVVAVLRDSLDTGAESGGGRYTFSDGSGAGSTVFSYHVEAPEQVTLPKEPGALPRAAIRITQSASYSSLSSSKEDEEDEDKPDDQKKRRNSSLPGEAESELGSMGIEVLDPALVGQDLDDATAQRIKTPDITSRTFTSATEVVYELVFENDRWRMAKPPAADAPESTNMALELALKRQQ